MIIRAITITQPWATLIAIGAKKIETRLWHTRYRGPIAIHAAKNFPSWARQLCTSEPFASALQKWGMVTEIALPIGCIVALADLDRCEHIVLNSDLPPDPELSFGDYTVGRWAWHLTNVRPLKVPIAANGTLGLWEWWCPDAEGLLIDIHEAPKMPGGRSGRL